jgi:hypothetical protein
MPVPPKDLNTAREPLHIIADCATRQTNDELKPPAVQKTVAAKADAMLVVLATPKDAALIWKAASVHPMQPLQNVHQRLARDGIRKAKTDDDKVVAESEALSRFYYFDAGDPKLLGVAVPPPASTFPEQRLADAVKEIGNVKRGVKDPAAVAATLKTQLDGAVTALRNVIGLFSAPVGAITMPAPSTVPVLRDALQSLADGDALLKTAPLTTAEVKKAVKAVEAAAKQVETALTSYCCIQNLHVISPFYLFRMLVRFRIESADALTAKHRAGVSGQLTGFLNNNPNDTRRWLFDYLEACIKDLDAELKKVSSTDLLFFLKGGRALKYLEKDKLKGENDWDTQVVVNPELPVNEWYDLYRRVHNVALLRLKAYKLGFYMLVHANKDSFSKTIKASLAGLNPLTADARARVNRMNCKAELIDIGIPRFDTVECHEQWHLMHGNIKVEDGVPIPDFLYYINEYVLMIREAFAEKSISIGKTPKRVRRLYGIVTLPGMDVTVGAERAKIPAASVPKTLPVIDAQNAAAKAVLTVLVRQFAEAYDLAWDPGLALAFDTFVDGEKGDLGAKVVYPAALTKAITDDAPTYTADHKALATVIGFGEYASSTFEKHLRVRGDFLWGKRRELGRFVKAIYTASMFTAEEELQLQFAVSGSWAAGLYADYFAFPKDRITEIEGVDVVDITVFSKIADVTTKVIDMFLRPLVDTYVSQVDTPNFEIKADPAGNLHLFWPEEQDFGDGFKYKPRAIRIMAELNTARWPNLAFVWGYPVVSLRDLIREYDREAARLDEFGAQQRLKKTSAALVEILTKYENTVSDTAPVDGVLPVLAGTPPALPPASAITPAAITDGTCHYLMISSDQGANGGAGAYPNTVAVAEQFLIRMGTDSGAWKLPAIKAPGPGVDRTLDLLVVNQGHGDVERFGNFSAADLKAKLVDPLIAAQVTANVIVLDFCLSATLTHIFAPLLAPGGRLITTMYSAPAIVVTSETWTALSASLTARNLVEINTALTGRMRTLTRTNTGHVNIEPLRDLAVTGDTYVGDITARDGPSGDKASVARYLRQIATAVTVAGAPATVATPAMQADLIAIKTTAQIGPGEAAVLVPVPALGMAFDDAQLAAMMVLLRARLVEVLTQPAYNINLPLGSLAALPTVGPTGLWIKIAAQLADVLGDAPGLEKLPSIFGVYTQGGARLTLDRAFTVPLAGRAPAFLDAIFPGSAAEVGTVNGVLARENIALDPQVGYLHV